MTAFTVLGGGGFIGAELARHLRAQGHAVEVPARQPADAYVAALSGRPLGQVVYCVGLTADFRTRPFETAEAHVGLLQRVLERCDFTSLTYLSSTRVYLRSASTQEAAPLSVAPGERDDIFAISKLMGEALCLASGKPTRIVRPSNVFGVGDRSENFLPSVLREAKRSGRVTIQLSSASAKDYVDVADIVRWIELIALGGRERIYNLASGRNTTNGEIAEGLRKLGVVVDFAPGGSTVAFPPIDVARVSGEFGPARTPVTAQLPALLASQA